MSIKLNFCWAKVGCGEFMNFCSKERSKQSLLFAQTVGRRVRPQASNSTWYWKVVWVEVGLSAASVLPAAPTNFCFAT